jgi:ABC-type transport system substrate-binding protein
MITSKLRFGLTLLVAIGVLAGCGQGGGYSKRESAVAKREGIFRYAMPTNPTTLDPSKVEDGDTIDFLQQVYEGLVAWDETNTVVPKLAEKWEIKDGGTTIVFTLRKDVKFHNGKTMTSEDVKWSLERACNPGVQSPVAGAYMGDIVGLKDVVDGKATEIKGIETPDANTVILKIDKPRPYFLGKFTYLCSAIMPKGDVPADREITKAEEMIGTGPFKVESFEPQKLVKLAAFADYHGGAPKVKGIERPIVLDAISRLNMYKSGDLDLVALERQDVAPLQANEKYKDQIKFFPRPAVWYMGLHTSLYAPFKDKRVRQAVAMAIDKDRIVNKLLGGVNQPANGVLPPGVAGHREKAAVFPYDVAAAKKLLADAGFPDGKGMPPLEIWFRNGRPDAKIVSEAVASQLQENLGIETKIALKEWKFLLEARNKEEIPFFHIRWAADYLDPENFISFFFASYGPENKIGYRNAELDALTSKADSMPDGPERLAMYAKAEDIALQDAVFIPIYFQRDAELIAPRVKGLKESAFGHLPHVTVSVD